MRQPWTFLIIATVCVLTAACGSTELVTLPDIDTSASPDGIVDLPDDVPEVFREHFVKYTYYPTPDGRRIHILASDGWTRDQIKHGRNVMEFLLTDFPGSVYGDDKSGIANAMADRKATMVFFNTEEDLNEAMRSGLPGATDLSMQDLRANESSGPRRRGLHGPRHPRRRLRGDLAPDPRLRDQADAHFDDRRDENGER